jgi:hypothetical protein
MEKTGEPKRDLWRDPLALLRLIHGMQNSYVDGFSATDDRLEAAGLVERKGRELIVTEKGFKEIKDREDYIKTFYKK